MKMLSFKKKLKEIKCDIEFKEKERKVNMKLESGRVKSKERMKEK